MKKIALNEYVKEFEKLNILVKADIYDDTKEVLIDCVSYDTRTLSGNSLFICKGLNFKEKYLHQALAMGAVAYVSEKDYEIPKDWGKFGANCIIVSDIRKAIIACAKLFYDNAPEKIISIGITGTKGKGTTAYFLQSILDKYLQSKDSPKCALISSIDTYDGVQKFESHLTTPETLELYSHFDNAQKSGISHLVMEVSSQALKYGRVGGVAYNVGCFTNLGRDHISPIEHPDEEDYFQSKLKIFDASEMGCVNMDSKRADDVLAYAKANCEVVTYGKGSENDITVSNIEPCGDKIKFHVKTPAYERDFTLGVPGIFNVENALSAIAISHCLEIPERFVAEGLKDTSVPGRMKVFQSKDGEITAIVDYAHNEMSFKAFFESIAEEYKNSNIVSVFGSAGDKAFDRRKDMPEIASKYSKHIVFTEDDNHYEPFESIASDMAKNTTIDSYLAIEDREKAIKHAILDYEAPKKVVAILGKGDETRHKRKDVYVECPSDVELAEKYIKEYDKRVDEKRNVR